MCIPFDNVISLWNSYLREGIEIHTNMVYKDFKYSFIYKSKDGTKNIYNREFLRSIVIYIHMMKCKGAIF